MSYSSGVQLTPDASRSDLLEAERQAQQPWRLRQPAMTPAVDALLQREFLAPQAVLDAEAIELGRILAFARTEVPYYRDHEPWRALRVADRVDRDALAAMPVMGKTEAREHFDSLNALRLPRGERVLMETASSGTTGTPVRVRFGQQAGMAFGLLAQRLGRWARLNPLLTQAVIRLPRDLRRGADGSILADNAEQRTDGWMYVRNFFHTGPQIAIARSNSLEFQLDWLRRERPAYLMTFPGTLETLVFAA